MERGKILYRREIYSELVLCGEKTNNIQDLAIVYNTTPEDAQTLIERIDFIFPKERIRLAKLGPALGVHGGPGILFVAVRVKA